MSNLVKGFFVSFNEEAKVLDSNDIVARRIQEEEEKRARLASIQNGEYDSDEFFEGLEAQNVDALFEDSQASTVIKNDIKDELDTAKGELDNVLSQIEDAKAESERILEEARAQAQTIKSEAFEAGRSEGFEAGMRQGMAEVEEAQKELDEKAQMMERDYAQMLSDIEPNFVDTLTDIYEHIFKIDLDSYRSIVSNLLIDAMNSSDSSKNIIVHVSKDDFAFLSQKKVEILTETGSRDEDVEFVQDATLGPAECMVETPNGVYDCSLETELRELKRKLMILSYQRN